MGLLVALPEPLDGNMGVDLGGGQAAVAQDFLHRAEVGPAVEQVRGGGVPEGVRSGGGGVPQGLPASRGRRCGPAAGRPVCRGRRGTAPGRRCPWRGRAGPGAASRRRRAPPADRRAPCVPCCLCRAPAGSCGRDRGRRRRGPPVRRPGCRWRTAAQPWPGSAGAAGPPSAAAVFGAFDEPEDLLLVQHAGQGLLPLRRLQPQRGVRGDQFLADGPGREGPGGGGAAGQRGAGHARLRFASRASAAGCPVRGPARSSTPSEAANSRRLPTSER